VTHNSGENMGYIFVLLYLLGFLATFFGFSFRDKKGWVVAMRTFGITDVVLVGGVFLFLGEDPGTTIGMTIGGTMLAVLHGMWCSGALNPRP